MGEEIQQLGKVAINNKKNKIHIPSKIQADTLFTFMTQLDFLIEVIRNKMISPRYCDEDIRYLKIPKIKKISFPMRCFCDINMHRLEEHLYWYGYYGIAFSKEWGMSNKIQPIQYINPESELCKDFSTVFKKALKSDTKNENKLQADMKSYILHQLFYYKPYEGKFKNRNTNKIEKKCFTDECEWRFVPNVTVKGYTQLYYNKNILNIGVLKDISNSMIGIKEISLKFNYTDIKYIIVKSVSDCELLVESIEGLKLDKREENFLISKIIIWDKSKGDF